MINVARVHTFITLVPFLAVGLRVSSGAFLMRRWQTHVATEIGNGITRASSNDRSRNLFALVGLKLRYDP